MLIMAENTPLFSTFSNTFFKEKASIRENKLRTQINWSIGQKKLIALIGDKPLTKYAPVHAKQFYQKLKGQLSTASANLYLGVVREIFTHAVNTWVIDRNPFKAVIAVPGKSTKTAALTQKEIDTCIEYLRKSTKRIRSRRKTDSKNRSWQALGVFYFGWLCGLRISDATTLSWSNIDFDKKTICLIEKKKAASGEELLLPLPRRIEIYLKSTKITKGFLFPLFAKNANTSSKYFTDFMRRLGITKSFHGLRSSFVSQLRQAGVDEQIVRIFTNHSPTMHEHYDESKKQRAFEAINSIN